MEPSLKGAFEKHDRAMKHLDDLMRAFVDLTMNNIEIDAEPRNEDGKTRQIHITITDADAGFEVIVGDCVQNLRSALDYLVYELACMAEGKPTRHLTQFPISTSVERYFKTGRHQVRPLVGAHRQVIRRLQPYQSKGDPRNHPLALLNRLSNQDKHRLLHVLVSHVRQISERPDAGPLGKTIVLPLAMRRQQVVDQLDREISVIGWVSFEFDDENRLPVFETLTTLAGHVRLILNWFQPIVG